MMAERIAARILIWISILTLVVSVSGFIATLILNAFVLDKYDAYGEVPIPGLDQSASTGGRGDSQLSHPVIGSPVAVDCRCRS